VTVLIMFDILGYAVHATRASCTGTELSSQRIQD